jgi:hypothetical protein
MVHSIDETSMRYGIFPLPRASTPSHAQCSSDFKRQAAEAAAGFNPVSRRVLRSVGQPPLDIFAAVIQPSNPLVNISAHSAEGAPA